MRALLAAVTILALLLTSGLLGWKFFLKASSFSEIEQVPFEAEKWRSADLHEFTNRTRSKMIEDLLRNYNFKGWTPSAVKELLGVSDSENLKEFDMVYFVGRDRGFGIDFEWLVFNVDKDGKVTSYNLMIQ